MTDHSELLDALGRLAALERLPRTGWCQVGDPCPESIADHVLGTSWIALALAPRVVPALDVDRVTVLALVHDAPEALLGDLPRSATELLPAGAKQAAEARAAERVLGPLSEVALARFREGQAGETREARFVKLCDKLHLGWRLLEVRRRASGDLTPFVEGIAALDASEFAPLESLRTELLGRLERGFA